MLSAWKEPVCRPTSVRELEEPLSFPLEPLGFTCVSCGELPPALMDASEDRERVLSMLVSGQVHFLSPGEWTHGPKGFFSRGRYFQI